MRVGRTQPSQVSLQGADVLAAEQVLHADRRPTLRAGLATRPRLKVSCIDGLRGGSVCSV